ncbi:thioredoxin family protein [Sphingobacterium sp. xlx-130]|uniref:thioredoxin family protein n=1 Tax=Sphingobacterium sp. xlx-130 TaxID=2654323 RepID=UPI0013D90F7D|nr:thioredoxin family protein [Sphingobacterium sp. xlx-130]
MKNSGLGIIFLIFTTLSSYAQGIAFKDLDYETALTLAKKENKNIFVDVYTSWCGPCKKMTADVFPLKEVGDYFNPNFISLKLDAEKQASHGVFQKFKPSAYPTYFWIDSNGNLLGVETGMMSPKGLIQSSERAVLSNISNELAEYEKQWNAGDRSYALTTKYTRLLGKTAPEKVMPIMEEYLKSLSEEEIQKKEVTSILSGFMRTPKKGIALDYILKYPEAMEKNMTSATYNTSMYRMIIRTGNVALSQKNLERYNNHIALMKASELPNKQMYLDLLDAEYQLNNGLYSQGFDNVVQILNTYGEKFPYLYRELYYSLLPSGFLSKYEITKKQSDELIAMAKNAFKYAPTKEAITFLASAYAKAGDYKLAYEVSSTSQFYEDPILPGILFKHMNLKTRVK